MIEGTVGAGVATAMVAGPGRTTGAEETSIGRVETSAGKVEASVGTVVVGTGRAAVIDHPGTAAPTGTAAGDFSTMGAKNLNVVTGSLGRTIVVAFSTVAVENLSTVTENLGGTSSVAVTMS